MNARAKKLLEQLTLRLDEDVHGRFEKQARILEAKAGVRISRSEVARKVLVLGLELLEREERATEVEEPARA